MRAPQQRGRESRAPYRRAAARQLAGGENPPVSSGRVLITGAGGFTGLALARTISAQGRAVRGLVRRAAGSPELAAGGVEVITGDVRDEAVVRRAVRDVELVYHLAAVFRRAAVP